MNQTTSTSQKLYSTYPSWKVTELPLRHPEFFHQLLDRILLKDPGVFSVTEISKSFEGRPIRLVSTGTGTTTVLLWSQMHGDEPTATMAIADILNYFRLHADEEPARKVLSSLKLLFLPMLNPDGAARFQRRTAQGIDMNRDALALQTPEARVLKQVQEQYKPAFGFNLHDQELSTVGSSKELAAIAVLAPAFDGKNSDNEVRLRAKRLAASFVETMNHFVPGKVAHYDDAFEPRAFGDAMQQWGTSTILIESGHALDDPEKHSIRKLNAVGSLALLHAIATGAYTRSDLSSYESLPFNSKRAYDVIIRNVRVQHSSGKTTSADLGISYQVDTHTGETPMLVDLGDLSGDAGFVGLTEIDAKGKAIDQNLLSPGKPFAWESYFPR